MGALIRSVLYIPGSKARALDKAASLPADAIIFDLEDAVAPAEKPAARALLAQILAEVDYGPRLRLVRINGQTTDWGAADLAAFADHPGVDGLVIPKVNGPQDLDLAGQKPLWAMMETPLAMLNAGPIAAHPRLAGLVMGTNDLLKDLGARFRPDRAALATGLGLCVLAARAHGKPIVDGVFNAFKDIEGLAAECEQGRDFGMDGKTLIHPSQIGPCNEIFAPSSDEVAFARKIIDVFGAPANSGKGAIQIDGKMVELLHAEIAKRTVAIADAIAAHV